MYDKSLLFTPEGVRDIYGEHFERRDAVQDEIHAIMKLYGFKNIETPTFEFFDIFKKPIVRLSKSLYHIKFFLNSQYQICIFVKVCI